MQNDAMESTIEKYRHELMEYSRNHPNPIRNDLSDVSNATSSSVGEIEEVEKDMVEAKMVDLDLLRDNIYRQEAPKEISQAVDKAEPMEVVEAISIQSNVNPNEQAYEKNGQSFPPYNNGSYVEYKTKDQFLQNNPENGFLRVQVFAANQVFPIQNAHVVVSKNFEGQSSVFVSSFTDASGIMPRVTLPAPDRALAGEPSGLQPYSTYDVYVEHPGFTKALFRNCAVFDGIETVQMVELIPNNNQEAI